MNKVIVLSVDHSILGTTTWKRAVKLIVKGRAEALADSEYCIHKDMVIPTVIRLLRAIRNLWRTSVPFSKHNIHVRDGFICQYCGTKIHPSKATIDHVIPKDLGGKNSWTNCVCSCFSCNNKKENRTPSQAHMSLLRLPTQPTIMEFLMRKIKAEGLAGVLKELGIY
jgi:5-methylcytosine-specific restriction endonuclease McrA